MKRFGKILFRLFVITVLAGMVVVGLDDYANKLPRDQAMLITVIVSAVVLAWLVWKWWPKKKAAQKCESAQVKITKPKQAQPLSVKPALEKTLANKHESAPAEVQKTEQVQPLNEKPVPEKELEKPVSEKTPYQKRLEAAQTKKVTLAGTAAVQARQGYLWKIDQMVEPFDCCTYGVEQCEYKGEPAFKVYASLTDGTDKVLGMVPANQVKNVLQIYDRIFEVDVDVYGGPEYDGDEKYYGASATFYYD